MQTFLWFLDQLYTLGTPIHRGWMLITGMMYVFGVFGVYMLYKMLRVSRKIKNGDLELYFAENDK